MPSGWKRNLLIALALVGVVVGAVWLNNAAGRRALERRKAELRAKGEKFTYAAWTGGKLETNGAARSQTIYSLASQLRSAGNFPMGLVNNMMDLEAPGRTRVVWRMAEPPLVRNGGSNAAALSWSEAAEEIADAGQTLRQLRAELASPPLDLGWDYDSDPLNGPRLNFVAMRNGAQWLAGATLVALHHGDTAGALERWQMLFALARMHEREPMLTCQMIRVAIGGLAVSAAWEILQVPGLTEEQLAALQSELQRMDFAATVANATEVERVWGLAIFTSLRSDRSPGFSAVMGVTVSSNPAAAFGDQLTSVAWRGALANGDELFYLDQMQRTIEAGRLLTNGRSWKEADAASARSREDNLEAKASWLAITRPLSRIAIPLFQKGLLTGAKAETLRQMTLVAIALRRHELRHGKLPAELAALVPEFLPKMPHDYFSGQPLRYRLNADGTFTLYSVGEDGKDDGGDVNPKKPNQKSSTLWDCPDAVWPKAAE